MNPAIPKLFFLLPAVFVLVGAGLTWSTLHKHLTRLRASSWPTTKATINNVSEEYRRGQKSRGSWKVKTSYTYEVGGTSYEGTIIHPTYESSSMRDVHTTLIDALQPGRTVQVQYCPENPSKAYLATGFHSGSLISVFVSMLFLGMGLAFGGVMWLLNYGNYDIASLIRPAL
jgi:hypothetical protein